MDTEYRDSLEGQEQGTVATSEEIIVNEPASEKAPWFKRLANRTTLWVVIALVIAGAAYYFKGVFVAAVVDGKPIARWTVIQQLEKTSGEEVLDALITKQLIEAELAKSNVTLGDDEVANEIKSIEAGIIQQGGTLQAALAMQGMTEEELNKEITLQKKLEKVLSDRIQVTEQEVADYIKTNKLTAPKDTKPEEFKEQVKKQLMQSKLSAEAQVWLTDLKSKASIKYFVTY